MSKVRIVSIVGGLVTLVMLSVAVALPAARGVGAKAPAAQVTGWEVVTVDTPPEFQNNDVQFGVVTCPIGKQVLGGGYLLHPGPGGPNDDLHRVAVVDSHPFPGHPVSDSWRVRAIRLPPTKGPWRMKIYAICAFVTL